MRRLIFATLILTLLGPRVGQAAEYRLDPRQGTDTVHIESSAKLEFLDGETQVIAGQFDFDPGQPQKGATALLSVDLRTLKTGIDKRDQHMRENHLHTDEFPFCFFEITSLDGMPQALVLDSVYTATAVGQFYIHGVKREIVAHLTISAIDDTTEPGRLRVRAEFEIHLDDFNIPRPRALFLKLAKTIEITIVFTLHPGESATPIKLPDWERLP